MQLDERLLVVADWPWARVNRAPGTRAEKQQLSAISLLIGAARNGLLTTASVPARYPDHKTGLGLQVSDIDALMRDLSRAADANHEVRASVQSISSGSSSVLRIVGPSEELPPNLSLTRHSVPEDWSDLVERVRTTAARIREVEADAQEQELRVRDLLERVREDIKAAHDRTQAAEAHARDVQMRTEALLKAADERVKEAEERARIAESWLTLVRKTFAEEFEAAKVEKRSA